MEGSINIISVHEMYSKGELMRRLGISQKFWDKMLDEGLPYVRIGHARWVFGSAILQWMQRHAERKGF